MRKSSLFLMFLIFLLALGFAASEEVKDEKMSFDLIFNANVLNDTLEIHVVLPHDATGSVLYTFDGKNYRVNVKNGDAPLNVSDLNPGKYELKANYSGNGNYSDIENKTMVTIPEAGKLALGDNSTNNDTNPVKNVTNKTNNVTNKTDSKNVTNNVTNKTDSKNVTNNVTDKTNTKNVTTLLNNVTNKTKNTTSLLNNVTNKTDSKNNTNPLKNITNNTANLLNNVTNKTNNTVVNNNTTVVVTNNETANNTAAGSDKGVDNISEVAHNSPKKPKINQNNNPYKLDAKTGIPIALVIVAIAIFLGIKRYNL